MLRSRGLAQMVGSLFLLQLGATMTYVGLPLLMAQRYGLGFETGVALALQLLPSLLMAGPVGVALKRFDARLVGILSALASAGVVALFPSADTIVQIYLLALATGVTFVFGVPARMALRTRVIAEGDEVRGNGMLVASDRLATILGPSTAGPLVALGGVEILFYAEAAIVAAAALLLVGIARGDDAHDEEREAIGGGLAGRLRTLFVEPAQAFRAMLREQPIVGALTVTAFGYVAAVGASRLLLAEEAPRLFGESAGALGYLVAAMAAGGVVGAVLGARLGRLHQGRLYVAGNLCEALCWPLLPFVDDAALALALMVLAGIFESLPTVVYYAEVQARLSTSAVGAYYAWLLPLTQSFSIVGTLGGSLLLAAGGGVPLSVAMACLIGGPILVLMRTLLRAGSARAVPEASS